MLRFNPYFLDASLLLMRLIVFLVFFSSGFAHLKRPEERAHSIGMSKGFTILLGLAEVAGALGVMVGVLTQSAALGLVLLMLGAIGKKIFAWHLGFWGKEGANNGWHYDLMFVAMNLVIAATDGGRLVLRP